MNERCWLCKHEIETLDDLSATKSPHGRPVCVRCVETLRPGEPKLKPETERAVREAAKGG